MADGKFIYTSYETMLLSVDHYGEFGLKITKHIKDGNAKTEPSSRDGK